MRVQNKPTLFDMFEKMRQERIEAAKTEKRRPVAYTREAVEEEDVVVELSAAAGEPPAEPETDVLTPEEEALLNELTPAEEAQEEQLDPQVTEHGDVGQINENKSASGKLQDESGLLARRLVAAQTQLEVVDVIGKAMKALAGARGALTGGDDNAKAARMIIKKLLKIVQRGQKKVGDLNHEDLLRLQETRERRRQEDARADEIKAELRMKIQKRQRRERKYLEEEKEAPGAGAKVAGSSQAKLDPATEAQIAMQAEAQASMEAAASVGGSGGGDMSFSGGGASSPASSEGGGSPAASGAGAPAGDASAGAEVDISV